MKFAAPQAKFFEDLRGLCAQKTIPESIPGAIFCMNYYENPQKFHVYQSYKTTLLIF